MKSLNGHLFAAVDLETTGGDEFEYEPVQIAAVPVDHLTLEVHTELQPFVSFIRPRRPDVFQPEAMIAHGFSMEQIMDEGLEFDEFLVQWDDWFRSLELKHKGGLIPSLTTTCLSCRTSGRCLATTVYTTTSTTSLATR